MPAGSMFHNAPLTSNETMGPLLESIVVIKWLEAVHPGLSNFIMDHRGDWFTEQTPNFCDIQDKLLKNLEDLIFALVKKVPIFFIMENKPKLN